MSAEAISYFKEVLEQAQSLVDAVNGEQEYKETLGGKIAEVEQQIASLKASTLPAINDGGFADAMDARMDEIGTLENEKKTLEDRLHLTANAGGALPHTPEDVQHRFAELSSAYAADLMPAAVENAKQKKAEYEAALEDVRAVKAEQEKARGQVEYALAVAGKRLYLPRIEYPVGFGDVYINAQHKKDARI